MLSCRYTHSYVLEKGFSTWIDIHIYKSCLIIAIVIYS